MISCAISKLSRILDKLPLSETERSTAATHVAQDPVRIVQSQDVLASRKHMMLDVLFRFLDSEGLPPWTRVPRAALALLLHYDGPRDEAFVQQCRELSMLVHYIESAGQFTEHDESVHSPLSSPTPRPESMLEHLTRDHSEGGGSSEVKYHLQ